MQLYELLRIIDRREELVICNSQRKPILIGTVPDIQEMDAYKSIYHVARVNLLSVAPISGRLQIIV